MGFFSNLRRSWKKSSRLQELEKIIAPPNQSVDDFVSDFMRSLESGSDDTDRALRDFLDLCESDAGVKKVMENEHLSRSDLEELFHKLQRVGAGHWIKGHYVPLSTIAYVEPLLYSIRAQKQGVHLEVIAGNLLDYWADKIPQGDLWHKVEQDPTS